MKAQSNTKPESFIKSKEKTMFNFNIVESANKDIDGTSVKVYNFDYVEIEGKITRDKLISAIIQDRYSKDAEIALLNNKMIEKDLIEYDEYQNYRADVKQIVNQADFLMKDNK